ncbi:hypothetical protein [Curtobacterium sp. Leaf261]|uniref:hypothetical protein n=1 Tax=Curtobacterium sp. Leaf261 TaxID=1736311 RepID=UPI0006FA56F6|nr:hypothetical protein [Curtobacterium sp. Leaf261]KQO64726.1 hypothetical protein ASF23_00505 [Curtobacterium sp. Leaf261]
MTGQFKYSESVRRQLHITYLGALRSLGRTEEEARRVWDGEPITISLRLRWWRRRMRDRLRWK